MWPVGCVEIREAIQVGLLSGAIGYTGQRLEEKSWAGSRCGCSGGMRTGKEEEEPGKDRAVESPTGMVRI